MNTLRLFIKWSRVLLAGLVFLSLPLDQESETEKVLSMIASGGMVPSGVTKRTVLHAAAAPLYSVERDSGIGLAARGFRIPSQSDDSHRLSTLRL